MDESLFKRSHNKIRQYLNKTDSMSYNNEKSIWNIIVKSVRPVADGLSTISSHIILIVTRDNKTNWY